MVVTKIWKIMADLNMSREKLGWSYFIHRTLPRLINNVKPQ